MEPNFISITNLHHSFLSDGEEAQVLKGINFSMIKNDFVTILGPSGCGKTTFLNLLGGLENPTQGKIDVMGITISSLPVNALSKYRRDKIAFIFQFYNLFPNLTAYENVKLGVEVQGLTQKECKKRADKYLDAVGLNAKKNKLPSHLSGGEQQRVAIARALSKQAPLILADEPTGNLDTENGENIMNLFEKINSEYHTSIVMITHDSNVAKKAKRIVRMLNGVITNQ